VIDRYYIEGFLQEHQADIRGRVLEVKDSGYTERFGREVTRRDVLDIDGSNRHATIVTDLAHAPAIAADSVDCFILTQTLQYIYEPGAAVAEIRRFLHPGGVVLATVPGIARIDGALAESDYWRFTCASCEKLFGEQFGRENVTVESYGNVLTAMAFLTGAALEELPRGATEEHDTLYPVIIAVRAVKGARA
jgi:hypothetical protein